jgi:thioredoxin 2
MTSSDLMHLVCPACDAVNRLPAERLSEGPTCGRCGAPLVDGEVLELNAARFERHAGRSDLPLLVDFWAPWCAPCRTMAPAFAHAARSLAGRVRLAKVNTEDEPALASRFAIRSIPTLILFAAGREIARQSGALDAQSLMRWVEAASRRG